MWPLGNISLSSLHAISFQPHACSPSQQPPSIRRGLSIQVVHPPLHATMYSHIYSHHFKGTHTPQLDTAITALLLPNTTNPHPPPHDAISPASHTQPASCHSCPAAAATARPRHAAAHAPPSPTRDSPSIASRPTRGDADDGARRACPTSRHRRRRPPPASSASARASACAVSCVSTRRRTE